MASVNPTYSAGDSSGYFTLSLSVDGNALQQENSSSSNKTLEDVWWFSRSPQFTLETFVTIFTTLVCVVGNSLVLRVAAVTSAFDNFNRSYLFSLTTADLFLGVFVTPFSVVCALYGEWVYGSDIFCCVEAYLMALFIVVSMISMAFIIVDHYVAVRKPDRYHVMMSFNRSLCWIVLTWVIATSFCCPPLFSLQRAFYYDEAFLCVIDRQNQQTYFLTVMFMVTMPTVAAVLITSRYLFTHAFQDQKKFYQRVYEYFSERSWNYYISFVTTVMFFLTWLPFTFIRVAQSVKGWRREDIPHHIHFYCMWFGLSNCFTKVLVYLFMSPQFRQGLMEVCHLSRRVGGVGGRGGRRGGYALCRGACSGRSGSLDNFDPEVITVPDPRK